MEEDNKKEQQEQLKEQEKTEKKDEWVIRPVIDSLKKTLEQLEKEIEKINDEGINPDNIVYLGKVIDAHKDLMNEYYWKEKIYMYRDSYNNYDNYRDNSFGRKGVRGTGPYSRYRDGDEYGRRGVPGSGRRYRGEEMLDEMMNEYRNYSDGKATYGADQNTMESFRYMLKAFKDYYKHLKQEASSQEEVQMLENTAREISEM